jgi:2-oxoisovalerate dehydrogenase E1 component alpha subunit
MSENDYPAQSGPRLQSKTALRHEQLGLSAEKVLDVLRGMLTAREVDDRLWLLSRQGKVHFVITSAGHEAAQYGCALAINIGRDYVVPYYRDMTLAMAMGQTPLEMMLHAMAKASDPASGGRQMFGHFSSRALRLVSGSSSVGSHIVHATGLALAFRVKGETDIAAITFFGEGATSEGAWHEGISFAGVHQLPIVFVCENNGWAISTHVNKESPVADIAVKAAGYNMPGCTVDGNDFFAVYEAASAAMNRARSGGGPTLLELKTYRLRPHSNADNDLKYRTEAEVHEWWQRDPIKRLESYVLEHDLITSSALADMQAAAKAEVDQAMRLAEAAPAPTSLYDHLYGSSNHA